MGIFIHWGLYSVPAFAATSEEPLKGHRNFRRYFAECPYAEWYANALLLKGSSTQKYHFENYGKDFKYSAFKERFQKSSKNIDIDYWIRLLKDVGAKYVIFVSKHHDGFCMWDTKVENPKMPGYNIGYDLIGMLSKAVREAGMHFGIYYSSLLDWTFVKKPIYKSYHTRTLLPEAEEYNWYCLAQWQELIDRYSPDILWSDIGYPYDTNGFVELVSYYKSKVPDGLINDRWGAYPLFTQTTLGKIALKLWIKKILDKHEIGKFPGGVKPDYRTTEYSYLKEKPNFQWEMCRGIDKSFGYNKRSLKESHISGKEINDIINAITPLNGRLLLNIGPDENGAIPPFQMETLKELIELRK